MTYLEAVKESGIEVGDTVRVVREWPTHKDAWANSWAPVMNEAIGNTYKVISNPENSRGMSLQGIICRYPVYSLELVKKGEPKPPVKVFNEGDPVKVTGNKKIRHMFPIGSVGIVLKYTNLSCEVTIPNKEHTQHVHNDELEAWDG